ncbi:MAG: hypothetical protein Q9208_008024 [Pyrenodesmia sp. 3 TL-2023]
MVMARPERGAEKSYFQPRKSNSSLHQLVKVVPLEAKKNTEVDGRYGCIKWNGGRLQLSDDPVGALAGGSKKLDARGGQPPRNQTEHRHLPHELSTLALYIDTRAMSSQQSITEMAFLPFPPGTLLHDPSTSAGAVWRRVLNDVSRAPGYCGQHWGYQVEEQGQVWYIVGMLFERANIAVHRDT